MLLTHAPPGSLRTAATVHGHHVPVRAEVVDVPDFSVHADADDLVSWVAAAAAPPMTVYVVHGEPASSAALARRIEDELGVCAVVPTLGERVRVDWRAWTTTPRRNGGSGSGDQAGRRVP